MITEVTGSIFDADVEALVNPVNCVGVMGAGLAKQFKEKYPEYFEAYKEACSRRIFKLGQVVYYPIRRRDLGFKPWLLISFPTKNHWKDQTTLNSIELGLRDLKEAVVWVHLLKSIAIPALGCGCGGLDWEEVRLLIYEILGDLQDTKVLLYPPQEN